MGKVAVLVLVFMVGALRAQTDVLTAQYNLNRTSSNMQESILTPANVNKQQFGKLFSRSVDAPFYASPLVVNNLSIPGVGTRNVVYVATRGNTVYAFDADDPNANSAYWSVNFGPSLPRSCCILGPSVGILSTPVIDRSTNTIYVVPIVQTSTDAGMYVYALDLATGAIKFNSPRRITFTFRSGVVRTNASVPDGSSWVQRAALLLSSNILYVGTSNVWEGATLSTQQGMIQAFKADDLSIQLGTFETSPSGAGGGFWQAGRGIAVDASGNLFAAINSGSYSPPNSFGSSVVKLSPGSLSVTDWFTPANWNFLYTQNVDVSANGVTLIPGTNLAFTGGKAGVIYLLNQAQLGGLEPGSGNTPLQQFQASLGCGTAPCGQHLPTAYWANGTNPQLYVWDVYDVLRAIPFDSASQRFLPAAATAGTFLPTRAGGMTVSSSGTAPGTGIVWAATAAQDPYWTAVPGALRAFHANDITQELYNSDQNSCRDSMGLFVKMSTPIVANGKVYVNTQSNTLPVYGLLSSLPPASPPAGTIHVTVRASPDGPAVSVDGNPPCTGAAEFDWIPGSSHTLAVPTPQIGLVGTPSPHTGTQFVWKGWSDGGAISHSVSPTSATAYTANFTTQYLLTAGESPESAGSISLSPPSASGYFDAGTAAQLTASPNAGCTFLNWGGAATGTANPQTVVMSGPQTVTANFQCSVPPPASFVTGFDFKILRNDFSGWVGMAFTVGASAINVSELGRILVFGNSATHTVKLVKAADGFDVSGGSVSLSMTGGTVGKLKYAPLASPVTLQPNTAYYLVSQETQGGDAWYDSRAVSVTSAGVVNYSIFSANGLSWNSLGISTSYVPVSFRYTTGGPVQYSLSTGITPAAGGNIAANPYSPTGSYVDGTPVLLTATPASGCSFVNWTGAITGSANPQTVTMSGARTVTANFQCAAPSGANFVTGYALNSPPLRRDFAGWVGMKLTVGASALSISSLGRICVANNAASHIVKLVNVAGGTDVPGAAASVNLAGCIAGQFVFAAINPVTLAAGGSYYLVSQETYGGDQWYDQGALARANVAVVNSSVYFYGGSWIPIGAANTSYVPANFQYSVITSPPTTQYQLTANASPASGGSITANPPSPGGNYDAGTQVQLTAVPASGCTFLNWTGALTGTGNPQNVTMTAPQTATANFQCSGPGPAGFVTGYALSSPPLRNDFTGWVGMKLTLGASALTVSSLGRICVAGNVASHTVKLAYAGDGSDVPGASASVNMAGCTAGQFVYASLNPIVLPGGSAYYLATQEVAGGDRWYDRGTISTTGAAAVNSAAYFYGASWIPIGSSNTSYAPVSFQYTLGAGTQYLLSTTVSPAGGGSITSSPSSAGGSYSAGTPVQLTAVPASGCTFLNWTGALTGTGNPQSVTMSAPQSATANFQCAGPTSTSFVTAFGSGNPPLRNDFTGWVGMKLTVGASPLSVSSLGRICAANNAASHTVRLVSAGDGSTVAGASVSINMAGCTAGQFVYGSMGPITLAAATTYYLVSLETQGGDRWYDYGSISVTNAAGVNSSVYFYNGSWIPIGSVNTSYVPVNFRYSQ